MKNRDYYVLIVLLILFILLIWMYGSEIKDPNVLPKAEGTIDFIDVDISPLPTPIQTNAVTPRYVSIRRYLWKEKKWLYKKPYLKR